MDIISITKFDHANICNEIINFFRDNDIPFEENLISFAVYGALVMSLKKKFCG